MVITSAFNPPWPKMAAVVRVMAQMEPCVVLSFLVCLTCDHLFVCVYSGPRGCYCEKWYCTCGEYSKFTPLVKDFSSNSSDLTHFFRLQIDSVLTPYYFYYGIASLAAEIQEDAGLTSLVSLVECAGLGGALDETFGITVFAPTDDAFKALDLDTKYYCGDGKDELIDILTYHVVPGVFPSSQIPAGKTYVE